MKKLLILFVAAFVLSTTVSFAQKVDATAMKEKIEKINADSEHAKKGAKASTWISRGDTYLDAVTSTTDAMYINIDRATVGVLTGKNIKSIKKETFGGREFEVYEYPFFTAYVIGGKVVTWKNKNMIVPLATAKKEILASYEKALSLDPGSKNKVKAGLKRLIDYYKLQGNLALEMYNMKSGASAYSTAAELQKNPMYGDVEPKTLYYAGYMYTVDGDSDAASFPKGEKALNAAIAAGYNALEDADTLVADADRGNIYYYLYHCSYGMREQKPEKIQTAKKYLEDGLAKYPNNEKIFEGLLQLYTSNEGVGDPKELLETIENNLKNDPNDLNTWFARGRIYFALKNSDECITSFKRVTEIKPDLFEGQYYYGMFLMLRGDEFLDVMNKKTYTDQASYDIDVKNLSDLYKEAIPVFEKAYELKPTDIPTLEFLKQLCFRLRDEPGMMDKYNKYNELYQAL